MGTRGFLASITAAIALLAAAPAAASLVQAMSLDAMTDEAEQVFVGRVIDEVSHYDDHERIVTDVHVQVAESVKGTLVAGEAVTIRKHGGVVGDVATRVLGEPGFEVGESVVLFTARRTATRPWRTVGMAQGALRIFEENGQTLVRSAPGDVALVARGADGNLVRAAVALPTATPLAGVLAQIRAHVGK